MPAMGPNEDCTSIQQGSGALFHLGIVALSDRPRTQNGNLPKMRVLPAVKAENVAHHCYAPRIPTFVGIATSPFA
jgi:hypothetical protein